MEFEQINQLNISESEKRGLTVLKNNADRISRFVTEKDYDWFHLVIGREGVGKSAFAVLFAKILDPSFSVERVVFSYEDFKKAVVTATPGQVVLVDEGGLLFFSRNVMKGQQKEIIQLLTIMRQRNLIVLICIPSLDIVESYIKAHRIRSLTMMKARGLAYGYGQNKVARLVSLMQDKRGKRLAHVLVKPGFVIKTPDASKVFPDFWQAYRTKKDHMIIGKHIQLDQLLEDSNNPKEVMGTDQIIYNKAPKYICERYGLHTSSLQKLRIKFPIIAKKNAFGMHKYSEDEFKKIYFGDETKEVVSNE